MFFGNIGLACRTLVEASRMPPRQLGKSPASMPLAAAVHREGDRHGMAAHRVGKLQGADLDRTELVRASRRGARTTTTL